MSKIGISKSLRFLQVFEIQKLKLFVKQTCPLGHFWGRPQESLRATEKVAFSQERFAIFGAPFVFEFLHSFSERSKLKVWLAQN